jgi:hypothetical protein
MNDRNLIRGLFLMAISLGFGLQSLRYSVGSLSRAGPGMFPLMVSGLLLLIGLITVARSRYVAHVDMDFNFKNIAIILGSLAGFALLSKLGDLTVGITFLVFSSGFAGRSYSVVRNIKVALGLIGVAFAFQKLLGLNLPLF